MNVLAYIHQIILPAAMKILPEKMDRPEARAMLLAIGLQESRFEHRAQIQGPARGFWQFEHGGGYVGVLRHQATKDIARQVLNYMAETDEFEALTHNDILACAFARLLLWTLPNQLPGPGEVEEGWAQYLDAWRPGKPHRQTWDAFYAQAWAELQKI